MKFQHVHVPIRTPVASLCWSGDRLIDWAEGGEIYTLDGQHLHSCWKPGYRFDAATQSPDGRYTVIYERLGTKALLLDRGKFLRELNRSYYHASAYEYPIALFEHPAGRTLIAHCPEEYNRVEIDDAATGSRLTNAPGREPADFFHSRLMASPGGTRLLSAGWYWHPFDFIATWSVADALTDGRVLDQLGPLRETLFREPVNSAVFIDEERIALSSEDDDQGFDCERPLFPPGSLGVFNLRSCVFENTSRAEEPVGTMLWLGGGLVVGFHTCPKIFDITTGRIIHRWPDLASGKQSSSIITHLDPLPPLALDPIHRRFAIASAKGIDVILLERGPTG